MGHYYHFFCMTAMLLDCAMQCIVTAANTFFSSAEVGLNQKWEGGKACDYWVKQLVASTGKVRFAHTMSFYDDLS